MHYSNEERMNLFYFCSFSDVLGTSGNWRYSINPCYGFFGSTTCSHVAVSLMYLERHIAYSPLYLESAT